MITYFHDILVDILGLETQMQCCIATDLTDVNYASAVHLPVYWKVVKPVPLSDIAYPLIFSLSQLLLGLAAQCFLCGLHSVRILTMLQGCPRSFLKSSTCPFPGPTRSSATITNTFHTTRSRVRDRRQAQSCLNGRRIFLSFSTMSRASIPRCEDTGRVTHLDIF